MVKLSKFVDCKINYTLICVSYLQQLTLPNSTVAAFQNLPLSLHDIFYILHHRISVGCAKNLFLCTVIGCTSRHFPQKCI
ncbi:hypothetical protein GDO86_002395 [Hymenochirus boettgeri]|uniref:Uncharacterized protein n=1 Tax=Hymenochirus boettgeri TaxID=247094 RepID=A0A8T2KI88_9PIPI|nr:hypothetical protein GDO86_002395 [Hymenochirus boettgeri]